MLSDLQIALGATGVLAGVTGAWSPCGFSMVDTLAGPARERGRLLLPACAAFTLGALAGGTALFGGLAVLGARLGLGGETSTGAAALVAAAAALAELAGARIRPQIRRQVPEPWRRQLPLPLASGLYGVLLGLGFATFVLTLAVVALAVACVASGDPALGAVAGLGFGLGRALPVVALAPITERPLGLFVLRLMAERPASLRLLRALDGVALVACALLLAPGVAGAAVRLVDAGADPSAASGALAWQPPSGPGVLRRADGTRVALPGNDPALGAGYIAWHVGDEVTVAKQETLTPVLSRNVARASKLAVSSRWLAWRARRPSGDAIGAVKLNDPNSVHRVAAARAPGELGRPDLDGDRLVFNVAGPRGSAIREVNLRTGRRRTRARASGAQLLGPSLLGRALLYIRLNRCGQQLILRRLGRTRVLLRRGPLAGSDIGFEPGHTSQGGMHPCPVLRGSRLMLWSTALSSRFAYVTALAPAAGGAGAAILRTRRAGSR